MAIVQSPLLTLPRELRDMIYTSFFSINDEDALKAYRYHHSTTRKAAVTSGPRRLRSLKSDITIQPCLLHTCRQLCTEASQTLQRINHLRLSGPVLQTARFLSRLPAVARQNITTISFLDDAVHVRHQVCISEYWQNICTLLDQKFPSLREVAIEVPPDASVYDFDAVAAEQGQPGQWNAIADERRRVRIANEYYWWPAPRALATLLMKGRIDTLKLVLGKGHQEELDVECLHAVRWLRIPRKEELDMLLEESVEKERDWRRRNNPFGGGTDPFNWHKMSEITRGRQMHDFEIEELRGPEGLVLALSCPQE